MNGEIVTTGEMKQAGIHADALRSVEAVRAGDREVIDSAIQFLDSIYWKGVWR